MQHKNVINETIAWLYWQHYCEHDYRSKIV